MSVGNLWLGTIVGHTIISSGNLAANSYNMTTTSLSTPAFLYEAGVTISGACTNYVIITLTPAAGNQYSNTIYSGSTSGLANIYYRPTPPVYLFPGDTVTLAVKNTNATGGVYGSIKLMY